MRLAPTTLALTMAEVKDFEQRRRFRKYLAKNQTFVNELPLPLPLAPRIAGPNDSDDTRDAKKEQHASRDESAPVVFEDIVEVREGESPKPLVAGAPKEEGGSGKGSGSQSNSNSNSNSGSGSGLNSKSDSLQTLESGSGYSAVLGGLGLGGRSPALPPPRPSLAAEARAVSEPQPLFSVRSEAT